MSCSSSDEVFNMSIKLAKLEQSIDSIKNCLHDSSSLKTRMAFIEKNLIEFNETQNNILDRLDALERKLK